MAIAEQGGGLDLVVLTFWQLDFKHCISSTFKNIVSFILFHYNFVFCNRVIRINNKC